MKQSFGVQRASYRQGLVLGLTMAEIMLLVVFTLLLVAGALLQKNTARIEQLEEERAGLVELDELKRLQEELKRARGAPLPESWRELVRIERNLTEIQGEAADGRTVLEIVEVAADTKRMLESLGYDMTSVRELPSLISKNMPPADQAAVQGRTGHNWPPIIRLSEADNYFFELGKAEISPSFRDQLQGVIIPKLLELIREYDVNVVEVIGHTDEVPIAGAVSNLDSHLVHTLQGRVPADELTFSDNAGLAMARASAVVRVLLEDGRLAPFRVLPLSGAQVVTTEEKLSRGQRHEMPSRRRIEIRLRRTSAVQ
jgi:flagellar motor protein MotB